MALLPVLIIGAGAMAGGYDTERREGRPLTHAGAFSADQRFRLAAVVEPDEARRDAFMQRWGIHIGAASVDQLDAEPGAFDVISICSPTALHHTHILDALSLKPGLIFAEKPVAGSVAETEAILAQVQAEDVLFAVNYTRRWDQAVTTLARQVRAGEWGAVRAATGVYTKGVVHNGGHMIDLLHLLLGNLSVVWAGEPRYDFWSDDPTVAASLVSEDGVPIQLAPGHADDYALFELSLITERGLITMVDGGMGWIVRRPGDSPHFPGYRALAHGTLEPGGYPDAMTNAVNNIARAILYGEGLACTGQDALAAQRVCEQIRDRALAAPANGPET